MDVVAGGGGEPFADEPGMEKRGTVADRRRIRNGRRATDVDTAENACVEMTRELSRLKTVLQTLIDAVQGLTASQTKPR